ncbi:MBL fold metallo-hydrolase [Mycoplasma sp. P36-A1]|uniref:MBL fold metallo-hydrolase n=1 Tax=Mycoplasma sp. P36-A1 TaxID=3252900 RepID=UPI003C309CB2
MKIRQISRHIYKIEDFIGNQVFSCWLIKDDNDVYLIDTLLQTQSKNILNEINKLGKLKAILITHGHADHISGLKSIYNASPVLIYANILEIPYISNVVNYTADANKFRLVHKYVNVLASDLAALPTISIDNYEMIGPLKPYHVPGHTEGYMAFYHVDDDVLIAGDLFNYENMRLLPPRNQFSENYNLSLLNSVSLVKKINPNIMTLSHSDADIIVAKDLLEVFKADYINKTEK